MIVYIGGDWLNRQPDTQTSYQVGYNNILYITYSINILINVNDQYPD
jgi:hypothetical protein